MASNVKKICLRCRIPFTDTGDGKEYYKNYHKGCMRCSICDTPVDIKNVSLKHSLVSDLFCNECDGIYFASIKNCLRCNCPFTDTNDDGSEYYRGYHKKCMKCATCNIALDATNVYLTPQRSKDLYCNDCKRHSLSKACLSEVTCNCTDNKNNTEVDVAKSEECIWYDCCSSINTVSNYDLEMAHQYPNSKNCSEPSQVGYRDLHGRKENLNPSGNSCAKNCVKAAMKIRTNIPQRLIPNSKNGKLSLVGAKANNKHSDISSQNSLSSQENHRNTNSSVASELSNSGDAAFLTTNENTLRPRSAGTSTSSALSMKKLKSRYGLRKPMVNCKPPLKMQDITPNSESIASSATNPANDSQISPETSKKYLSKTFTNYARTLPVKAFPPKESTNLAAENASKPTKENKYDEKSIGEDSPDISSVEKHESPISSTAKERTLFLDCSICFDSLLDSGDDEALNSPTNVVATSCGHIFHEKCIKEWLKAQSNKRCPICCTACSPDNLLTIFVDARSRRLGGQPSTTTLTRTQEIKENHKTLEIDYEDLKLKHENLVVEHDFCRWKSVVIQSLQSAYDLESNRRQELEKENEHLLQKIEDLHMEAFIKQSSCLKPFQTKKFSKF